MLDYYSQDISRQAVVMALGKNECLENAYCWHKTWREAMTCAIARSMVSHHKQRVVSYGYNAHENGRPVRIKRWQVVSTRHSTYGMALTDPVLFCQTMIEGESLKTRPFLGGAFRAF